MADPVTGIAATILSGIGVGLHGAGALSAAGSAERARGLHRRTGLSQARALETAAERTGRDAQYIRRDLVGQVMGDTQERVGDFRSQGQRVLGAQSLDYVRGGVRVSGSALRRLQGTGRAIERGAGEILQQGDRQADQLRRTASDLDRRQEDLQHRAELTREFAFEGQPPGGLTATLPHLAGAAGAGLEFATRLGNLRLPGADQTPQIGLGDYTNRAPLRPQYNTPRATLQI